MGVIRILLKLVGIEGRGCRLAGPSEEVLGSFRSIASRLIFKCTKTSPNLIFKTSTSFRKIHVKFHFPAGERILKMCKLVDSVSKPPSDV